ncbi:arylsulfatase A-like [Ptychodera flava]|uniref:arylsulfatase A-like n=1 Tax=Ptychodera flava TaxID=63121 RepID=UPI00396A2924
MAVVSYIGVLCLLLVVATSVGELSKPNIVILFADDVGYGDIGCYGHPTSSTPHIDKLASSGMLFTQFYVGSPVCSPSRASLLTGRLPPRTGVYPGVFQANMTGGLPLNETTVAKLLQEVGYQTGMIGKWHLGVGKNQKYLPTNFGFEYYLGIPYTHAQCPCVTCFWPNDPCLVNCKPYFTGCPIFHNNEIIEQPADLLTLNEKYATAAQNFIAEHSSRNQPFFLYYAFQHCHAPQFAGKQFRNSTLRGVFGDSLAEIDWSVGQVLEEINKQGIADNTLIFFSSDNGPSTQHKAEGGAAGLLKCGKGTTYEGGQRVPGIAVWPGKIPAGVRTAELASTMDLLPTLVKLTGSELPNTTLDGFDISSVLFSGGKSQRDTFFFYPQNPRHDIGVYAVRYQQYKAHFYTEGASECGRDNHDVDCRPSAKLTKHNPPLLFNLNQDPSELYNLNTDKQYTDILNHITQIYKHHVETMDWTQSEILKPTDPYVEPCCTPGCEPFPSCCQCHRSNPYSMPSPHVLQIP